MPRIKKSSPPSNGFSAFIVDKRKAFYVIILCHRYTEEREHLEAREAVVTALSKAIPELSGSSE